MKRIALVIAALCVASSAHADSRAWTAAKKSLPAGLDVVVGANAGALRSSKVFRDLWPKLLASNKDLGKVVDQLHDTCALDALQIVDSAVVGGQGDTAIAVVVFKGLVQKDVEACLDKLSRANDHKPMAIAKVGGLVKYGDGSETLYAKWLGKDTIAVSSEVADKDVLLKLTAGGITGDKVLKTGLAAVKTDAAAWVVANKSQDLDQVHAKMSQIFGWSELKADKVGLEVHVVVDNAKVAADAASTANLQLTGLKASGQIPAAFLPLLKSVAIKSAASDLVITASLAETEMVEAVKSALSLLGH